MNRKEHRPHWRIMRTPARCWYFECWTPLWHRGRGPYINIRLGRTFIYRSYF